MQVARRVIRVARAFDGERLLPGGAAVFVQDGRIVGVEAADAPVPEGWRLVDFCEATLLPGLVDVHCHLDADSHDGGLERMATVDEARLEEAIDDSLRRQLAAGVTTVRDLGDRNWSVVRRRDSAFAPLEMTSLAAMSRRLNSSSRRRRAVNSMSSLVTLAPRMVLPRLRADSWPSRVRSRMYSRSMPDTISSSPIKQGCDLGGQVRDSVFDLAA